MAIESKIHRHHQLSEPSLQAWPPGIQDCPAHYIDIPCDHDPQIDALMAPRPAEAGTLKCRVHRTDRNHLELFIESGRVFVLSAIRYGRDWLISDRPLTTSSGKQGHIARLRSHTDSSFTCIRRRYEASSAPRETLFIRHTTKDMQEDLPALNMMQGALPLPAPDAYSKLHPWERERAKNPPPLPLPGEDLPAGELAMQTRLTVESKKRAADKLAVVVSRLPKWNNRSQTYELPFTGRANWASARNFQLVEQGGSGDRVVLLYGKMAEDEFAMDFAYPLSHLHAFAICLTTFAW